MDDPCPICGTEMEKWQDTEEGRLYEQTVRCPAGCYLYEFAYGSMRLTILGRTWEAHWTETTHAAVQRQREVREWVEEHKAQARLKADREQFIRDNAVALVGDLEAKVARLRKEITRLGKKADGRRRAIDRLNAQLGELSNRSLTRTVALLDLLGACKHDSDGMGPRVLEAMERADRVLHPGAPEEARP